MITPLILAPSSVLPILASLFDQRNATYAARLCCDDQHYRQALPLMDLLKGSRLDETMHRHAAHWRSGDLRAVASAWSLDYFAAMLIPAIAAMAVLRHRLPLACTQVRVMLTENGRIKRICLPDAGHMWPEALPQERYEELIWQHLMPLIEELNSRFKVPSTILWGNALRHIHAVLQRAALLTPPGHETLAADRRLLLHSPFWPDGRINPLYHRRADPPPHAVYFHRNCCLYYRLPGEGYCNACPLRAKHNKSGCDQAGDML